MDAGQPSAHKLSPRPWRLGTALTVMGVALLLILLLVSYFTYLDISRQRRAAEIESAVALSRSVAARVDSFSRDIETMSLAVALALGTQQAPFNQSTAGPYLARVRSEYSILRALFVTDLHGRVVASASGEGIGLSLAARPYVKALRAGAFSVWSEPLAGLQSGQVTVAFGRVIQAPDGQGRGYLLAAFYPSRLLTGLHAAFPASTWVTLLDHRGFVLHTTYNPQLPSSQRDLSGLPIVQEALRGRVVRITGSGLFPAEPRLGALVPVARNGWVVAVTNPLAPLESEARTPALRQMGAIMVALLIAGAIGLGIALRLIRPLEKLAASATAIARGERPRIDSEGGPAEVTQLVAGMQAMSQAVAEREDALRFMAEASKQLSGSLDHETILKNLASLAVPTIADWCIIYLANDDGSVRRLKIAHADPSREQWVEELAARYPPDPARPSPVLDVIRDGQPQLTPEISDTMLAGAARDEEQLRILRELGFKSSMIVPMVLRGQALGAIVFVSAESGRRYGPRDLEFAEELARRAALAVENARLYERQIGIAEMLQRSLLRRELPDIPGVTVAARYLPAKMEAKVGGDWYDVFALPDGRLGLVMGDVAGRGVPAASLMGQLQHALRAYAMEGHSPAVLLERLNQLMDFREMATLLYLIFDPTASTVRFGNAGHPPPLVISPDGTATFLEGGSAPLRGTPLASFHEEHAPLPPGALLILYTDGLVEVRGQPIDEGLARLAQVAARQIDGDLNGLLDRVVEELLGGEPAGDDVAVLAMRATALDPSRLVLRVPAAPSALPTMRHTLRRWLTQAGVHPADVFEISVACAEACANAIEHAYQAADASIEVDAVLTDGEIAIAVRDWGQWRPPRGRHRGRGMLLMRGLMDEVTVVPRPDGTTVQMRRPVRQEVRT